MKTSALSALLILGSSLMIMTSCQKEELPTLSSQTNSNTEMAKESKTTLADIKNNISKDPIINHADLIIKSEEAADKKSNNINLIVKKNNLSHDFPVLPANSTCTSQELEAKKSKIGSLKDKKNQVKGGLQLSRTDLNVEPSDRPKPPTSIKMLQKQN
jgi:hypothetical protein